MGLCLLTLSTVVFSRVRGLAASEIAPFYMYLSFSVCVLKFKLWLVCTVLKLHTKHTNVRTISSPEWGVLVRAGMLKRWLRLCGPIIGSRVDLSRLRWALLLWSREKIIPVERFMLPVSLWSVLGRRIALLAFSPVSPTFWKIKVNKAWVHTKWKLLHVDLLLLFHKRTTRLWKA